MSAARGLVRAREPTEDSYLAVGFHIPTHLGATLPYRDAEAQREYQRQWVASRRGAYFKGKSCARCGSNEDLELDHMDPTAKITHRVWSWSDDRRKAELSKCQILCSTCHKVKTIDQMPIAQGSKPYRHGTSAMYRRHKCRCGLCKLYNRNYWRAYRSSAA